MIKTAQQLKAKIRNLSYGDSNRAQVLMRVYMMERFLERVSISRYGHLFILKGGMLVASMVGLGSRSTLDIDATLKGATLEPDVVREMLREIASIEVGDGVYFCVLDIARIMDDAEYLGLRVSVEAQLERVKIPLKIDISTGDAITPREIRYSYELMFEDRAIKLWAYNLETILAEKLQTVLSRATLNTRMRDFYDMWALLKLYGNRINGKNLQAAFAATAQTRGDVPNASAAGRILDEIEFCQAMQGLWSSYAKKFEYAKGLPWCEVVHSARALSYAALDSICADADESNKS